MTVHEHPELVVVEEARSGLSPAFGTLLSREWPSWLPARDLFLWTIPALITTKLFMYRPNPSYHIEPFEEPPGPGCISLNKKKLS
jgi:hypothetical protein